MNKYEVMYILDTKVDGAAKDALIEKYSNLVKENGGEVESIDKWGDKNRKPCPAGKTFGVIGPNGLYRTCLHSLPKGFCR